MIIYTLALFLGVVIVVVKWAYERTHFFLVDISLRSPFKELLPINTLMLTSEYCSRPWICFNPAKRSKCGIGLASCCIEEKL